MSLGEENRQLSRRNWLTFGITTSVTLCGAFEADAKVQGSSKGLSGLDDAKAGQVDRTPFDGVVDRVRSALEAVGVEKAPEAIPEIYGPPIPRDYPVGRRKGSDRLQSCPEGQACVSSSQDESSGKKSAPYVYLTQKGDALGMLLEMIDDDPSYQLLSVNGNFFNGGGVYVLAEKDGKNGAVLDCEFNFLPGVLENLVGMRVVQRTPPDSMISRVASPRDVVNEVGRQMKWISLAENNERVKWVTEDDEDIFLSARIEWDIRGKFEKEVEDAQLALGASQAEEQARMESLKTEITRLLDQIQAQNNIREKEQRDLLTRVDGAREEYYNGVLKRQGSYKNSGRYSSVSRLSAGSSIGVNINKNEEDVTTKILSGQNIK
eukprot:CAMPEP_0185772054 /NCGR_PEP_ID=MMETSP1174-20130828/66720_1 /TAXON_ID=35687 /ORGANISM="Dictyocha speculum, Strain CCMP1381" /LENGTH=376 /DNA_ID=CAMNT_0028458139 /DNA_START=112 /DNA_END=1242 /DNA_ORIENTATION=-